MGTQMTKYFLLCFLSRSIPEQGNRAEVVMKVLHRNIIGGDDFLGQVSLPLQDFDVYEKPKAG